MAHKDMTERGQEQWAWLLRTHSSTGNTHALVQWMRENELMSFDEVPVLYSMEGGKYAPFGVN